MGSAATQAKKRDLITSKEIEISRRAEFARSTTLIGGHLKSYYKNGAMGATDNNKQSKFGMSGMDFAKTHN